MGLAALLRAYVRKNYPINYSMLPEKRGLAGLNRGVPSALEYFFSESRRLRARLFPTFREVWGGAVLCTGFLPFKKLFLYRSRNRKEARKRHFGVVKALIFKACGLAGLQARTKPASPQIPGTC